MKKLFIALLFGFLLSGNVYAHNEDKFVFLICETDGYSSIRYEVHIDFKKKTVSSFNMSTKEKREYKIHNTTERWISSKAIDNESERIIIHRYVEEAVFQEFKDDKWKDISYGKLFCDKIKKKF